MACYFVAFNSVAVVVLIDQQQASKTSSPSSVCRSLSSLLLRRVAMAYKWRSSHFLSHSFILFPFTGLLPSADMAAHIALPFPSPLLHQPWEDTVGKKGHPNILNLHCAITSLVCTDTPKGNQQLDCLCWVHCASSRGRHFTPKWIDEKTWMCPKTCRTDWKVLALLLITVLLMIEVVLGLFFLFCWWCFTKKATKKTQW